jgi:GDPmannose 4,6-dehydratase
VSTTTALITGAEGQDGVLLTDELLRHGRRVIGTVMRRTAVSYDLGGPDTLLVEHDVRDEAGFARLLEEHRPDEIYNLAALSSVGASWAEPVQVALTNGVAVTQMLEQIRQYRDRTGLSPRYFQASSPEIFGLSGTLPHTESTPVSPRNPYGIAKALAHQTCATYRSAYDLFIVCGILYPHESPLRPRGFVTRKIARGAAEIALGLSSELVLGNLDVRRDWGAATDVVRAMRLSLEHEMPDDYVIATGFAHSLEDFLVTAFAAAGLGEPWPYVRQDPELMRPADVPELRGDATKARTCLGWTPTRTFREIVEEMVQTDLTRLRTGVEESLDYLPR